MPTERGAQHPQVASLKRQDHGEENSKPTGPLTEETYWVYQSIQFLVIKDGDDG